jgi:hypothetical protein
MITLFVPGKLTNPLNGSLSRAHWSVKRKWALSWQAATWNALNALITSGWAPAPEVPKCVTFHAQTAKTFDDDGLRAALKPVRDALMGFPASTPRLFRVIHSDAPDSGHEFVYAQRIDRKARGVQITISPRPRAGTE